MNHGAGRLDNFEPTILLLGGLGRLGNESYLATGIGSGLIKPFQILGHLRTLKALEKGALLVNGQSLSVIYGISST